MNDGYDAYLNRMTGDPLAEEDKKRALAQLHERFDDAMIKLVAAYIKIQELESREGNTVAPGHFLTDAAMKQAIAEVQHRKREYMTAPLDEVAYTGYARTTNLVMDIDKLLAIIEQLSEGEIVSLDSKDNHVEDLPI